MGKFTDSKYNGTIGANFCCTNGKCTYKGGYKHGIRDGFGICFYPNGQIKYMGDWKDKAPKDGNVTRFKKDGKVGYRGEMIDGKNPDGRPFCCFS